jgi:hypothetical protein
MNDDKPPMAEEVRLDEDARREKNWKRWGPYLSARQWGTVREDYSADGDCWNYLTHDKSRSQAYRWGEDGILGITDRECRLCFAVALWNGRDPILKERLFGLTGPEGNHGEDVKECYFFLDSSPTHAYMKALYKYPQAEFPYQRLVEENARRSRAEPEFELTDTGVFDDGRYFDVFAEYAKRSPNDILIKLTVTNRGPELAPLHLLPTLWFRNTWSWGCSHENCDSKPWMKQTRPGTVEMSHATLGRWRWEVEPRGSDAAPEMLFTENESNLTRLYGTKTSGGYVKDAFHEYVLYHRSAAISSKHVGTKSAAHYLLDVAPGRSVTVRLRLFAEDEAPPSPFGADFDETFQQRVRECDEFYKALVPPSLSKEEKGVARQAYAGLLWSKQFYHYVVEDWLKGDPLMPPPPPQRWHGRNADWLHLYSRDVISMPDTWEYPWFAAWDLAFHMIPFAKLDAQFAKEQLLLLLREWYMHPSGQIPAYEFNFGDVNPPVHAWACWRVYKMTGPRGRRDRTFLARAFQKLMINFTWWVNRKDVTGKHIFAGGFLGLDNIGIFDRSKPLPTGGNLEQADGTAWMAFFCATMLAMALELAEAQPEYEDIASKFFEHFVAITDAMNTVGGTGLWDEEDGFYYDQLQVDGKSTKLKVRSMVGLIPLFACEVLEHDVIERLPGFKKRLEWFLKHRKDLARHVSYMTSGQRKHRLLAIPSRERLGRVLRYMLDESEFLSPHGIRSVSKVHDARPYTFNADGQAFGVRYVPGESDSTVFGGNSNWRGPVWFPLNYLIVEVLERYHYFYGDALKVECPTGSGRMMNLKDVARELAGRLAGIFLPGADAKRPCHGDDARYANDPAWRDLVLFHEYFHGETGKGLGASHQTGWTALVTRCLEKLAPQQEKLDLVRKSKDELVVSPR